MSTAFVTGAATPLGVEVVAALSRLGVACVAHLLVDVAQRSTWQRKLSLPMVRLDASPWDMLRLTQIMEQNTPSHVYILTGTTQARARAYRLAELPADNFETVDFKKTDMVVDAVLRARHEAHLVYLSAVGASVGATDPHLQALARGEQKVIGSTCPYTIVRAPFVRGGEGGWWFDEATARAQDVLLRMLGLLGGGGFRDRYLSIPARDLARTMVAVAHDRAGRNRVVDAAALHF